MVMIMLVALRSGVGVGAELVAVKLGVYVFSLISCHIVVEQLLWSQVSGNNTISGYRFARCFPNKPRRYRGGNDGLGQFFLSHISNSCKKKDRGTAGKIFSAQILWN